MRRLVVIITISHDYSLVGRVERQGWNGSDAATLVASSSSFIIRRSTIA